MLKRLSLLSAWLCILAYQAKRARTQDLGTPNLQGETDVVGDDLEKSFQYHLRVYNDTDWWRDRESPCARGDRDAGHEFTYSSELFDHDKSKCHPRKRLEGEHCQFKPDQIHLFNTHGKPCWSFCEQSSELIYGQEIPLIDYFWVGYGKVYLNRTMYFVPRVLPMVDTFIKDDTAERYKWNTIREDMLGGIPLPSDEEVGEIIDGVYTYKHLPRFKIDSGWVNRHELSETSCGYFAFVPILKKTCGILTHGETCNQEYARSSKICLTTYYMRDASIIHTKVIFVATDCETKVRKVKKLQSEVWRNNHQQIPLHNNDYHQNYGKAWIVMDKIATDHTFTTNNAIQKCTERVSAIPMVDCQIAMSEFMGIDQEFERPDQNKYQMSRAFGKCLITGGPPADDLKCRISNQMLMMYVYSLLYGCAEAWDYGSLVSAQYLGFHQHVFPGKRKIWYKDKAVAKECGDQWVSIDYRTRTEEEKAILAEYKRTLPVLSKPDGGASGKYDILEDPLGRTDHEFEEDQGDDAADEDRLGRPKRLVRAQYGTTGVGKTFLKMEGLRQLFNEGGFSFQNAIKSTFVPDRNRNVFHAKWRAGRTRKLKKKSQKEIEDAEIRKKENEDLENRYIQQPDWKNRTALNQDRRKKKQNSSNEDPNKKMTTLPGKNTKDTKTKPKDDTSKNETSKDQIDLEDHQLSPGKNETNINKGDDKEIDLSDPFGDGGGTIQR